MKPTDLSRPAQPQTPRRRPLLLAGAFFLLGVALTGIWFQDHQAGSGAGELSAPTKNLLGQLEAPVTIRYYSLLPGNIDETLQGFAGGVAQWLTPRQAVSDGEVQIASFTAPAETNTPAASADGLQ